VVEPTHLKNMSQIGSSPQPGDENNKYLKQHLGVHPFFTRLVEVSTPRMTIFQTLAVQRRDICDISITHRFHGAGMFTSMKTQKSTIHVGEYTSPMDPMGLGCWKIQDCWSALRTFITVSMHHFSKNFHS